MKIIIRDAFEKFRLVFVGGCQTVTRELVTSAYTICIAACGIHTDHKSLG